ncbi:putative acetyltransferase YhhY [compost metagenome]|jgi:RimJ/RimL family protein N-acetyltransferase
MMKEASPAITLQRATEQHIEGLVALYSHPQVTRQALYKRHGFEVEGQLRDYAMRDGRLTDVYSMARLQRRER